ncbi:MAG: glycosyltransferase [Acidobacteria bacterium]|nr:glycosyltransferase [Acidobacteriota bacterium]
MSGPAVSIVLPTRNGAATLPALLDAVARQQVTFPVEVVAVDSASTDGTVELLRGRVDRLITIAAADFDHGLTRNRGIEESRGDLIVLMVQDALPASDTWLAALTAPLCDDDRVAGAFARQLPRPDASPITRWSLARWVASSEKPHTHEVGSRAAFDALGPAAQFERCVFDNVCSCIRRSVWSQTPFARTPIAEDLEWAKAVLLQGYRLAYVPGATVIHSHDRSARYEFARTYVLHRRLYALFGLRTIPTLPRLIRAIVSSAAAHLRVERTRRALALACAWPLGQYLGAQSAIRGWSVPRRGTV